MAEYFAGCGQAPGLRIWVANKFKLEALPDSEHGVFFSGDSYLILHTFPSPGRVPGTLRSNIHFWLGQASSVDEQGTVAVHAAQLDELLGGGPVQYRQSQGAEDEEFRKLFPKVIIRPSGRFASGFTQTASRDKGPTKLYHIKSPSKAFIQVTEVPPVVSSLNSGDCFVLELPSSRSLYIWRGAEANIREKMRALDVANSMCTGSCYVKVIVLDDGDTDTSDACSFFTALGEADPAAAKVHAATPDVAPPPGAAAGGPVPVRLFKVAAEGEPVELPPPLSKGQLDSQGQFCVVAAGSAWVWTGAQAKAGPSLGLGLRVLAHLGLPPGSAVRCVKEEYEPALFTTYFPDWANEKVLNSRPPPAAAAAAAAAAPKAALDTGALAQQMVSGPGPEVEAAEKKKLAAALEKYGLDGTLEVWVVRGSVLEPIPPAEQGELYSSDSYVVDYEYADGSSRKQHVLYFWVGRHSSSSEQGTAALLATEKHHAYNGFSTLARVAQGQEPPHFVRVFSKLGGLIVHRGDRPPAGQEGRAAAAAAAGAARLYQVKAEAALGGPYAVEVDAVHSSLNSGDCFLLLPPSAAAATLWLWTGAGAAPEELAAAGAAATRLAARGGKTINRVKEGAEGSEFWAALGGKGEYPKHDPSQLPRGEPKLFNFRDTGGAAGIKVEPYTTFSQEELCADDVAMLDSGRELFLWFGSGCTPVERSRALGIAKKYAVQLEQQQPHREGLQASIIEVACGREPPFFTQHFPGWDSKAGPAAAAAAAAAVDVAADQLEAASVQE